MNKVFLLLRNNIQLGPFTIDELLQQNLSTDDLIWVEGYSLAWSHPSEIDLLKLSNAGNAPITGAKPSAPESNANNKAIKDKNLSSNKNRKKRKWADEDIEGRAEEIRRRTLEYVSSKNDITSPLITDDEIRSFVKTPDIDFVVHKKSRGVSANFIGAMLVAIMLVAGWYGKDKLFIAQNNSDLLSTQTAAPQVIPISSTVQMQPSENESAAFMTTEAEDTMVAKDTMVVVETREVQKSYSPPPIPVEQVNNVASTPDANQKKSEEIKADKQPLKETEENITQPVKKDTGVVSSKADPTKRDSSKPGLLKPDSSKAKVDTKSVEETEEAIEKKKTLGQAIKGIFKKKKKDKDTEDESDEN